MSAASLPLLSGSLLAALLGFVGASAAPNAVSARRRASATAGVTLVAGLWSAARFALGRDGVLRDAWIPAIGIDATSAAMVPLMSLVALAVLTLAPRATLSRSGAVDVVWVLGLTLWAFCAESLTLLTAAWVMAALPIPRWLDGRAHRRPPLAMLALGSLPMVGAVVWLVSSRGPVSVWSPAVGPLAPRSEAIALAAVIVSTMARTALFPFHPWLVSLVRRDLAPLALSLASPLSGLYVLLRFGSILPHAFPHDLPGIAAIGLTSATVFALLSLGQRDQLGTMLYLVLSQYGLVFMGLGQDDPMTVRGTLVLWLAQGLAGTGLVLMALGVRWRRGSVPLDRFHGLVRGAPHMAGAYFLFGMAVVGLPGTVTFVAAELLGRGILSHHPWLATGFVTVTATNAVGFIRSFGRVFLGEATEHEARCPDLRPKERAIVLALAAALILPGVFPHPLVGGRRRWANDALPLEDGARRPALERGASSPSEREPR